jgi:YVTN family beta-propeller protein
LPCRPSLLTLLLLVAVLLLLPGVAPAQQATLVADSYTNTGTPNDNHGSDGSLIVGLSPNGGSRTGFLRFKLTTSLPANVTAASVAKATLRLYLNDVTSGGQIDLYRVVSPWSEATITPENQPALGAFETSFQVTDVNSFVVVDVTQLVKDWLSGPDAGGLANNGVALVGHPPEASGTAGVNVSFDSKEERTTSHEPSLEITISGPQGAQGLTGPQGPAGPKGDKGDSGDAANTEALKARLSALERAILPTAYVANRGGNTVSVIEASSNAVLTTITVGAAPAAVAVNPLGTRAYVANSRSDTVSVIDTSSNTVVATIKVEKSPLAVAVNPSGARVYVANGGSGTVSVIDTTNNKVLEAIKVADAAAAVVNTTLGTRVYAAVAVNPSGTRVYAANNLNTVSVIDTSNNKVVTTVDVRYRHRNSRVVAIAVNPSGTHVYAADSDGVNVSVIDTSNNNVVAWISFSTEPAALAVNPSGTRVYVADHAGAVAVINTSNNTVIDKVIVGGANCGPTHPMCTGSGLERSEGGAAIAVNPSGTHVYVGYERFYSVSVIDASINTAVTRMLGLNAPTGIAFK